MNGCDYPGCDDGHVVGKRFCHRHLSTPFTTRAEINAYHRGQRSERLRVDVEVAEKCKAEWMCGFAVALAESQRRIDRASLVIEVLKSAGITIDELKAAGLDEYDLKVLRRARKEA
jgi:hypothetical protein